jgi:hypothetical protein
METFEASARRESFVLRCAPVPWSNDPVGERYVRSFGRRRRNELDLTDTIDSALRVTLQEASSLSAEIREKYGVEFTPHGLS